MKNLHDSSGPKEDYYEDLLSSDQVRKKISCQKFIYLNPVI